jgi:hypothetical protein
MTDDRRAVLEAPVVDEQRTLQNRGVASRGMLSRTMALLVVVIAALAVVAGAFGVRSPWVLGKSGAVGKKARTTVLVKHLPAMYVGMATERPRLIKRISVQVFAQPRQRVTAGYVLNCVPGGRGPGAHGRDETGQTPLTIEVDPQPFDCKIYADATLSAKGRLTLRVIARPAR